MRAFFGLVSYYRRCIKDFSNKDFAKVAEPLSRLKRKNNTFVWKEKVQKSFEHLKRALADTVTLANPTPDVPFIMDTDASDVAIGAVLSQKIEGLWRPIAFFEGP